MFDMGGGFGVCLPVGKGEELYIRVARSGQHSPVTLRDLQIARRWIDTAIEGWSDNLEQVGDCAVSEAKSEPAN